jgi:hypothetical protein
MLHTASWAGRLNSGVSRQTGQDQKRCVESAWRLSRGNLQQLRAVKNAALQLRASVSGIRKGFMFGSTAVGFPARRPWVLSPVNGGFNHGRLRLLTCGGMLGKHGGNSWQVPGVCRLTIRSSRNRFVPAKIMAKKACHVFASTTRFGLTQVLGRATIPLQIGDSYEQQLRCRT